MQPHNTTKPVTNDLDSEVSHARYDSRQKGTENSFLEASLIPQNLVGHFHSLP